MPKPSHDRRRTIIVTLLSAAVAWCLPVSTSATGQQLLANDKAKVKEVRLPPGDTLSFDQPGRQFVILALSELELETTTSGGLDGQAIALPAGQARPSPHGLEAVRNIGDDIARWLEVHSRLTPMRPDPPGPSFFQLTQMPSLDERSPGQVRLLLDNDLFQVVETNLPPGGVLPAHDYMNHVVYALEDIKLELRPPADGKSGLETESGSAVWLTAGRREVGNSGDTAARYLLIGVKPPQRYTEYEP